MPKIIKFASKQRPYSVHTMCPQHPHSLHDGPTLSLHSVHDAFMTRKKLLQCAHGALTVCIWRSPGVHSIKGFLLIFYILIYYFTVTYLDRSRRSYSVPRARCLAHCAKWQAAALSCMFRIIASAWHSRRWHNTYMYIVLLVTAQRAAPQSVIF